MARRPKIDEGVGRGLWKEVARLHREFSKKRTAEEMATLLERADRITRGLDGLDRIYAEIYVQKMREFLVQWRVSEERGWTRKGGAPRPPRKA
ncbi:MAG: hypothetical protein HY558_06825 [Euryarchaeota archaeon]|nr:hypothetical protein [Euryarchaeota archaeon]